MRKSDGDGSGDRDIPLSMIVGSDLSGPVATGDGDMFRSDRGFVVLLRDEDGVPVPRLLAEDGGALRVTADGHVLSEDEMITLLWERLETFDEVIARLAGPMPAP